jgi:AraC-like DNA-binding protein
LSVQRCRTRRRLATEKYWACRPFSPGPSIFFCKHWSKSHRRIAAVRLRIVKTTLRQAKSASSRLDPRIHRVLKTIPERLERTNGVSLKTLAAISGLSPSRFMHVFTESVGVPLRPYILGLRLERACSELLAGATVTSAAHSAGFSDAAHLTRTFRRTVGITPSKFLLCKRSPSIHETDSCDSGARSRCSALRRQTQSAMAEEEEKPNGFAPYVHALSAFRMSRDQCVPAAGGAQSTPHLRFGPPR